MSARHEELMESAAAYALGALDADDLSSFEGHLSECDVCRAEVDSYREVVALLVHALPSVRPANDAALRERIVSDATQVRPITGAVRDSSRAAVSSMNARRMANVAWAAAAAAVILAGMSGVVWRTQRSELDRLRMALAAARMEAASDDSVVAALLGPEVHVVSLSRPGSPPAARVFWNHTLNQFIVAAFDLPPAPAGQTWQLWAVQEGRSPVSMGTFDTDANGRVTTTIPVSAEITDAGFIDACGLTLEPAGGSPQPTEPPRLTGEWRHVD
jgi:anti-sigma-K factor RskA